MPAARAVRGVSVFFIVGTMRFRQPRILRAPRECDRTLAAALQRSTEKSVDHEIKPPRSKLRGMNCAFPSSRFPTGLRRKRRGIRPEEIEVCLT